MKREENAKRAQELLQHEPMSRFELECKLKLSQQRVSEAMRDIGALIVGYEPRDCRGRPMPIYALPAQEPRHWQTQAVSSVWDLGSRA